MIEPLDAVLRLGLAVLLSGVIGLEREVANRPAGFRTHVLVGAGSTPSRSSWMTSPARSGGWRLPLATWQSAATIAQELMSQPGIHGVEQR